MHVSSLVFHPCTSLHACGRKKLNEHSVNNGCHPSTRCRIVSQSRTRCQHLWSMHLCTEILRAQAQGALQVAMEFTTAITQNILLCGLLNLQSLAMICIFIRVNDSTFSVFCVTVFSCMSMQCAQVRGKKAHSSKGTPRQIMKGERFFSQLGWIQCLFLPARLWSLVVKFVVKFWFSLWLWLWSTMNCTSPSARKKPRWTVPKQKFPRSHAQRHSFSPNDDAVKACMTEDGFMSARTVKTSRTSVYHLSRREKGNHFLESTSFLSAFFRGLSEAVFTLVLCMSNCWHKRRNFDVDVNF